MSQTDVRKIIPAQSSLNVPMRGEFVFLKVASAKVRVTIHDEPVEMEAGDFRRVVKPFNSFEVKNETGIDQPIELVVGFGTYNRLVVRGDISSFESVIGSQGIARPDTREPLSIDLGWVDPTEYNEVLGRLRDFKMTANFAATGHTAGVFRSSVFNQEGDLLTAPSVTSRVIHKFSGKTGALMKTTGYVMSGLHYLVYHPTFGAVLHGPQGFYRIDADGAPVQGIRSALEFVDEKPVFLPNGDLIYRMQGLWYWFDGLSSILKREPAIVSEFFNLNGAPISDQAAFTDGVNSDRVYWHLPTIGIYVGNLLTRQVEKLEDSPDFSWSEQQVGYDLFKFNYRRNRLEYGVLSVGEMAQKTADYWGRLAVRPVQSYGLERNGFSGPVELNTELEQQEYSDADKKWFADIVRIALEKYRQAYNLGPVPIDYMDYVHGLSVNGINLMNTGFQSFERMGVRDFFSVPMPCRVELTTTQELRF